VTFFRENLSLKLASLALAIGVWFYVRGEDRPVQIVSVPLEIRNLPEQLAIAGDVTDAVNVRVKGPEIVLNALSADRITARLDLSNLEAGDHLVRLKPDQVRLPAGASVIKINPEYVALRLEKKLTRELPVAPRVVGEPSGGYVLGGVSVSPDHVHVEGPESAVRLARDVLTDVVRIDGRTSPMEVMVNLFPDRPGVHVLSDGPAMLTANIRRRYVSRVLQGVPVRTDDPARATRLAPASIEVTLEGPPDAVSSVSAANVSAVVEVRRLNLRPGSYRLKPRIVFVPEDLSGRVFVQSIKDEEINVKILPQRDPQ